MRARPDKIRIPHPLRPRPRAEGEDVEEGVGQAQDGAAVEVELGLPFGGRVDRFLHDQRFEVLEAGALLYRGQDGLFGRGDEGGPGGGRVRGGEVAYGDEADYGVLVWGGGCWVDAGGDVDVLGDMLVNGLWKKGGGGGGIRKMDQMGECAF